MYKPRKYQDEVQTTFKLKNLKLRLDRMEQGQDLYGVKQSDLKGVCLKLTNLDFFWSMAQGKIN